MGLLMYLLAMAVWVGAVELLLYRHRQGEYRRIGAMRQQAEMLLREAQLARLRATVSLHAAVPHSSYQRRAS